MNKVIVLILIFTCTVFGCTNTPRSIAYGSEGCHFCSMTIVDKQHAALFMTKKGRTYSFDASECMLNHLKEIDAATIVTFLVNDYNAPGETIDATKAMYLISKNIPSPMGEYLTAFNSREAAEIALRENGGELLTWEKLQERFK